MYKLVPAFMLVIIFISVIAAVALLTAKPPALSSLPPWNGGRAMSDIETQVGFGARAHDSPGHAQELTFIRQILAATSTTTEEQHWTYTSPDAKTHEMTNIIAHFDPDNSRRIILGTHYDSIIRAYRDKVKPDGYMPGANNSASGVALLLETARSLALRPPPVGVDMIFFDGEEGPLSLGAGDPDWKPLGSPYFADHLPKSFEIHKPESGLIFDMVCYKNAQFRPEKISVHNAYDQTRAFWKIGAMVSPSIFNNRLVEPIGDDQMALSRIGIPSVLVIGFEYEPWFNTTEDTPDKCSASVMEGLGKTVLTYLFSL